MIDDRSLSVLDTCFGSRGELAEALLHDADGGGLFVAGEHPVSAGDPVRLRIRVEGIEPGLIVRAVVLWRRIARGAGPPSGIGVRFDASDRHRWVFLRDLASGAAATRRSSGRVPATVSVAFVKPGDTAVHRGCLTELSETGAQLQCTAAPVVDSIIILRLRDGRSGPPLPMRVVWARGDVAGLCLARDRDDANRFWHRIYESASAELGGTPLRGAARGDDAS